MKKLFTFVMALVAVMTMNATVVTLNASDFTAVGQSAVDQTVKGVRVQITNGLINSSEVRIYKNATITITATEEMSAVVFHCTAPGTVNYGPGNFTAVAGYTYYKKAGRWAGNATTLALTASGAQVRASSIDIYTDGETPAELFTEYTITTDVNNTGWGITKGDTTAFFLDEIEISAIPNYGYHFVSWNDGSTSNPRIVEIVSDCIYRATFVPNTYSITKLCIPEGSILGNSQAQYLDSVRLEAKPNFGYHFTQWSDGVIDNPRTIVLSQDTTFIAEFAKNPTITYVYNALMGSVQGPTTLAYDTIGEVTFKAVSNDNYHFVQWSDGVIDNPRTIVLSQDTIFYAEFAKNPTITYVCNALMGSVQGPTTLAYDTIGVVTFEAIPKRGYQFVRWADGNTDNPRTIELTQDTTMEAIFDYLLEGKCGKDSVLTWKLDTATMALNITGKGALSENYTYGKYIESVTIGNEVTSIGGYAFGDYNNLKNVTLGISVKVLEEYAFYNCYNIETITCYSQRPPTVNNYALYRLDYSTIVYVPADYLNTYKMHDAWGLYDVRPLGATSAETDDIKVTPTETTAEVVWPAVSGAATYELVIRDKDGNVICTLIFNAQGQLTQIAFGAPARDNAPQQTQSTGFSFTVTGLESGTGYDLTMTAKDTNGTTLQENTMSFITTGGEQGVEDVSANFGGSRKLIRDGQILILRGNHTYTLTGQEVR